MNYSQVWPVHHCLDEGITVFMLCKREKAKIDLPSRADVERAIVEKLFGSLGERYLLRLRRAASIERR